MDMLADQWEAMHVVFDDVERERLRQHSIYGEQNIPLGFGEEPRDRARLSLARAAKWVLTRLGKLSFLDILREEFFEVATETDPDRLRTELIQLAAVAVQAIERLDRIAAEQPARCKIIGCPNAGSVEHRHGLFCDFHADAIARTEEAARQAAEAHRRLAPITISNTRYSAPQETPTISRDDIEAALREGVERAKDLDCRNPLPATTTSGDLLLRSPTAKARE